MGMVLHQLGTVYMTAEQPEQALRYFQEVSRCHCTKTVSLPWRIFSKFDFPCTFSSFPLQALTIREAALGATHPTTAVTLTRLGSLYLSVGELEEAEVFLSRALNSRRAALGPDHPETAESMGKLGV